MSFAAGDQRPEPGVVLCRGVVAGEKPVFSPDRHSLQRSFAGVVVDVEEAAGRIARERLPLVLGVSLGQSLRKTLCPRPATPLHADRLARYFCIA